MINFDHDHRNVFGNLVNPRGPPCYPAPQGNKALLRSVKGSFTSIVPSDGRPYPALSRPGTSGLLPKKCDPKISMAQAVALLSLNKPFWKIRSCVSSLSQKGSKPVEVCEGQSIFDSRTGGKKLQLHPLLKKKCAPAIFLRWKEFRMEICFSQKKTPNLLVPSRHTREKTPLPKNATSLTCSDRSVVADDVGRNSLVGWTYVQPPVKMKVMSP